MDGKEARTSAAEADVASPVLSATSPVSVNDRLVLRDTLLRHPPRSCSP
jgi:hypothetical protein